MGLATVFPVEPFNAYWTEAPDVSPPELAMPGFPIVGRGAGQKNGGRMSGRRVERGVSRDQ
jgi:hypothetical protein